MLRSRTLHAALLVAFMVVAAGVLILGTGSSASPVQSGDSSVTIATPSPPRDEARPRPTVTSTTTTAPAPVRPVAPPKPRPAVIAHPKVPAAVSAAPGASGVNAFLNCVGKWESGDRYGITSGRYGILVSIWRSEGFAARYGTSTPGAATPAQQDQAAMTLYLRYGSRPWSTRGKCGG